MAVLGENTVEVLIVGGGPVGLTARALLARWGVRTLLVEKRAELSPFPRSRLVNVRSMEIFRQLGLAATIAGRAFAPKYGRVCFRDTMTEPDLASSAMVGVDAPIPESPVIGAVTSQDRLEPVLLGAANAPVRFGAELVDLVADGDGAVAVLVDQAGVASRVRARYVVAADGARSTVRQRLGIDTVGPGAIADVTTVVFDADLDRWCDGDRPGGVYFTAHGSFTPLYPEGGWAWFGPTPDDAADWAGLVSRALGGGVPVDVVRVQHWAMTAFVAERFGRGRILLAGDAAHTVPPIGGLGMNVGIADVHNLCWKLAGVLRGWAEPGLLETYETERRPVARRTLDQAVANARLQSQALRRRREQLRAGGTPDRFELPWSERYFAQLGLVLGVNYHADDGMSTDTDYVPTARPGHRMPHLWLTPDRSTLDACGEWLTLFTPDPAHWRDRITEPWPLRVEALSSEHAELCGLGPHGALLVRPDGHISGYRPDR